MKNDNEIYSFIDDYHPTIKVDISQGIWVRRLIPYNKDNAATELAIIISEHTTIEELRNAWAGICYERDLLHQEQGTLNSNIIYLHELALIKKSASYADIAHDINFYLILCFFCILQRVDAVAHVHADFMLGTIFQIMKNVYIGKETEWLKDVNNFREERLPWTPFEGPISWSKARLSGMKQNRMDNLEECSTQPGPRNTSVSRPKPPSRQD